MSRKFELRKEVRIEATPQQVWEAITTSEGMAAWLFPSEDTKPDGPEVTTWDPPSHLVVQTPAAPDGSTHAFEYLIEAREAGVVALRFVHSGVLSGDWNDEYEDMTGTAWGMYLHTLAEYLTHFPGRRATYIHAEGPSESADARAWPKLLHALGLTDAPAVGDKVRLDVPGLAPAEGVVDYVASSFLGIRTADAMYRFHGRARLGMTVAIGHHIFRTDIDQEKTQQAWQTWLNRTFT